MGRSLEVALDCFPLVVTTARDPLDLDDLAALQRSFESLFARGEKFATITDTRDLHAMPSAEFRHAVAEWDLRFEAEIRRYNVAGAAVIESTVIRAAFRTVHWLAPHPTPFAYVATMDDAVRFAVRALERAAVPLPDAGAMVARFGGRWG